MKRYIEKFKNYLVVEKNYSPYTIKNYLSDLNEFSRFLSGKDAQDVDYLTVRKFLGFLRGKAISKRSVARKLSSLRTFFKFLQRDGYVKASPVTSIATPKLDKKLPIFLDEKSVLKLITSPDKERHLPVRTSNIHL